jgi:hypothetical protein
MKISETHIKKWLKFWGFQIWAYFSLASVVFELLALLQFLTK